MTKLNHRKMKASLQIVDSNSIPIANSSVNVKQISHKFLFGCGAFCALDVVKENDDEKQKFFEERVNKWLKLFNYGTLPFYWGRYEPVEGKTMESETRKTAEWLKKRGVTIKGHPLCWHTVCADWLLKYSNEEILEKQLARINREVSGFKELIDAWDVINEVVIMPVFDKYDNAVTRLCKDMGRVKLVKTVFDEAKRSNPATTLLINDFNTTSSYEKLIEDLLEAGVQIGAIGIQSHQHQGYWGDEKLFDVLERFSRFKLPIHFTENNLISGKLMPPDIVDLNDYQVDEWPSTKEGEIRQAKEVEHMYRILFENPNVEAITSWDYMDGLWLNAPAGFLRTDDTIKPSYEALDRLINKEWKTNIELITNEDGYVDFEGFKGNYELTLKGNTTTLELTKDTKKSIIL